MLKDWKYEFSSASIEKNYDEMVENHLSNKEEHRKYSMKMKDILHELESPDDENDSHSAPDLVQTNRNDNDKVVDIDLSSKNHSNMSSDELVMFVKVVPNNDLKEIKKVPKLIHLTSKKIA